MLALAASVMEGSTGAAAAPATAVAQASRTCTVPKYPGVGYFTSLTVKGVTCSTGRRLALAYYRCRTRSGPSGHCAHHVLGFACRETRNAIPTEIDARVTCRRSGQTVIHTYQQDT